MGFHLKAMAGALLMALAVLPQARAAEARDSWVVQQLYTFNHPLAARLPGEVETKMKRMDAPSPFPFFRGTAHLFYQDMLTRPASAYGTAETAKTWLNGDMHIGNFGADIDSSGTAVFDVNDNDEGYWGPFVWDLRRTAASIVLAARANGISDPGAQTRLVGDFIDSYLDAIRDFRGTDRERSDKLDEKATSGYVKDIVRKAQKGSRAKLLKKYTTPDGTSRRFTLDDPADSDAERVTVPAATYHAVTAAVAAYVESIAPGKRQRGSYYAVKDICQKLGSGIGSLGRPRYLVLIEGPGAGPDDDVILEMKEEAASAVAIAAPGNMPSGVYGGNEGRRAAMSLKAAHIDTNVLVGWTRADGRDFLVRERSPSAEDFEAADLTAATFPAAVGYMGKALAANHARADKDYDSTLIPYSMDKQIDEAVTSRSGFRTELTDFAMDYAKQVELDHASFRAARRNGTPLY